jgi:hypothetical protein
MQVSKPVSSRAFGLLMSSLGGRALHALFSRLFFRRMFLISFVVAASLDQAKLNYRTTHELWSQGSEMLGFKLRCRECETTTGECPSIVEKPFSRHGRLRHDCLFYWRW